MEDDLALGQPSFSSSAHNEFSYSGAAVDEFYKLGECFVSIVGEIHQWLSVYLGGFYQIRSVGIITKSLHDLEIFLARQHPSLFWNSLQKYPCNTLKNITIIDFSYLVTCLNNEAKGEFIVVYSLKDLHICRLQVWGDFIQESSKSSKYNIFTFQITFHVFFSDRDNLNIALGKPVALSSAHEFSNFFSYLATDGLSNFQMAITGNQDYPWICVDLLDMYLIRQMGILISAQAFGKR